MSSWLDSSTPYYVAAFTVDVLFCIYEIHSAIRDFKEAETKGKAIREIVIACAALLVAVLFGLGIYADNLASQRVSGALQDVSDRLSKSEQARSDAQRAASNATESALVASQKEVQAEQAAAQATTAAQNTGRHLTTRQQQQLLDIISPFPKLKVGFFLENGATDAERLANDMWRVFASAGWELIPTSGGMMGNNNLRIWSDQSNAKVRDAIATAMLSFGIRTSSEEHPSFGGHSLSNTVGVLIGFNMQ